MFVRSTARFCTLVAASMLIGALAAPALAQSQPLLRKQARTSSAGAPAQTHAITVTPSGSGSNDWTFALSQDGKQVQLQMRDGKVVDASVDGEKIPEDRIKLDADKLTLLGADGSVLFSHMVPDGPVTLQNLTGSFSPAHGSAALWNLAADAPVVNLEPPKVMIGVQMAEPDASLRGHFGLEPDQATLISAIYEGLPAHAAGVELYDIIIACDGVKPAGQAAVRKALADKNPGDKVTFTILHKGQTRDVTINLEAYDTERFKSAKMNTILTEASAMWMRAPGADSSTLPSDVMARYFSGLQQGGRAFIGRRPDMVINGEPLSGAGPAGSAGTGQSPDVFVQAPDHQRMLQEAQRMADRMQQQTDDLNRLMNERMVKLEEMLQRLIERQKQADDPAAKPGKS